MTAPPVTDPTLWRDRLWEAVSEGDERTATHVVLGALDEDWDPESVLLDLIAPVQGRIGQEWAANRMTVAQEHAATAINDRAIAALTLRHPPEDTPERGRITVACVDGEWHALPARLVAEVLRLRGWRVDYLGAQVPTDHLIAHVHQTGPVTVALSSSIATRLPVAHAAITAVQATGTPVLVGGAAFGPRGRYARLLGADAWAADARTAADRLAGDRLGRPASPHQPIDDLPHLADQEYTMVARTRPQLVRTVIQGLEERFPAMGGYSPAQRSRTAEDVDHIVHFLATALYTDDAELFTGFLTWTADVLTARAVPSHSLTPALDVLSEELKDFPRATRILERAAAVLAPGPGSALDSRNHA
ncbi:B12-binding domain-containing protein [Streptomyces sp. NPDC060194]|uniref:cobalamin B12-binding domain-containing protein n=1 Tax=Streptomyces sp. NPDC060194 TaxID=3347069 RepID=UPI00365CD383